MTPTALNGHLSVARRLGLPSTLTVEEWTHTIADFAGLCAYCQEVPVSILEHFIPVRHGGGTTAGNCLPACHGCNSQKGPLLPKDFEAAFGVERVADLRAYLHARSLGPDHGPAPAAWRGTPDRNGVQINLRLPPEMLRQLDAWIAELNEGRRVNKVTRTGALLALLDRGLDERPTWETLTARPAHRPIGPLHPGEPRPPGERFVIRDEDQSHAGPLAPKPTKGGRRS